MTYPYRFTLQCGLVGRTVNEVFCYEPDTQSEEYRYLTHRFDKDDVRAIMERDSFVLDMLGGVNFIVQAQETRAKRREVFKHIAGEMGLHFLNVIEYEEGWQR